MIGPTLDHDGTRVRSKANKHELSPQKRKVRFFQSTLFSSSDTCPTTIRDSHRSCFLFPFLSHRLSLLLSVTSSLPLSSLSFRFSPFLFPHKYVFSRSNHFHCHQLLLLVYFAPIPLATLCQILRSPLFSLCHSPRFDSLFSHSKFAFFCSRWVPFLFF